MLLDTLGPWAQKYVDTMEIDAQACIPEATIHSAGELGLFSKYRPREILCRRGLVSIGKSNWIFCFIPRQLTSRQPCIATILDHRIEIKYSIDRSGNDSIVT